MAPEQQLPPDRIKELATAAIVKRRQAEKRPAAASKTSASRPAKPSKALEQALDRLTKELSDFYGFAAVPHSTKEHRLLAELVSESWVPLEDYERQVQYNEEAQERIAELQREVSDLRKRIEHRIEEIPRLKAVIRAALARLVLDTQERHVREEWAVVMLRRIEAAREILKGEAEGDGE